MTPIHRILGGLLLAQVALGVATWWPSGAASEKAHALFSVPRDQVTALTVVGPPKEGKEAAPVRLEKDQGAWVVASLGGYPADETKVSELLDKVVDVQVREPVASRSVNHNALKVGEKDYARRVTVTAGGQSTELVLGTASSNAANVRLASADDVFQVRGFSVYSIGDTDKRYYDPVYLSLAPESVRSFTVANGTTLVQLDKQGEDWMSPDLPPGARIDGEKVTKFLKKFASVRMTDPVGREVLPEFGLDGAVAFRWAAEEEGQSTSGALRIGATVDGQVFAKRDDSPWVVKIREGSFKDFREATLETFLAQ